MVSDFLARGRMLGGATGWPPKSLQVAGYILLWVSAPIQLIQSQMVQPLVRYGALTQETGCLECCPHAPCLDIPVTSARSQTPYCPCPDTGH